MASTQTDGGYYAIKGFEFQIDKTILELLKTEDENESFKIENIQDLSSNSFVMQIKYKEEQSFIPSKIKAPTIQLLNEFKKDKSKDYYLYAYFGDLNGYEDFVDSDKRLTIEKLNQVLGNKKNTFTEEDKNDFVEKLYLDFSSTFQDQFEEIIKHLNALSFIGASKEEATFYYAMIEDFLRKLVIKNKKIENRICTKKQIFDYIQSGKNLIFKSSFKEYEGEIKYLKFIKSKFRKIKKNKENFIFIGNIKTDSTLSTKTLISSILSTYYTKATYDIKPLTFIVNNDLALEIKRHLINQGILINDGYEHIEFNNDIFFSAPIINRKTAANGKATDSLEHISFKIRIVSLSKFKSITKVEISPDMIYYFDTEIIESLKDFSYLKIDALNAQQIYSLITS